MKCLTICQPYPYLIMLPESDPRHKRVENRDWPTNYRGQLLIHAGKSKDWISLNNSGLRDQMYGVDLCDMQFGAIVGVADMLSCMTKDNIIANAATDPAKWNKPWDQLAANQHMNGPWCWLLSNVRKFQTPIPYRGAQGLFEVPMSVVAERMAQAVPQ